MQDQAEYSYVNLVPHLLVEAVLLWYVFHPFSKCIRINKNTVRKHDSAASQLICLRQGKIRSASDLMMKVQEQRNLFFFFLPDSAFYVCVIKIFCTAIWIVKVLLVMCSFLLSVIKIILCICCSHSVICKRIEKFHIFLCLLCKALFECN